MWWCTVRPLFEPLDPEPLELLDPFDPFEPLASWTVPSPSVG
jgi:hypothetical protein